MYRFAVFSYLVSILFLCRIFVKVYFTYGVILVSCVQYELIFLYIAK